MKKYILAILFLINLYFLFSVYDTEYSHVNNKSHEWQQAGLENGFPVNFVDYPFNTTNTEEDIRSALLVSGNSSAIRRVILSPGEYLFTDELVLADYVVLRGNHMFKDGENNANRTVLRFDMANTNNCIEIKGVEAKPNQTPPVQEHILVSSGIEDIVIERLDSTHSDGLDSQQGHNILIQKASNCWVVGVESRNPVKHHIDISKSEHIEVTGCYFKGAQDVGAGGFGYGVITENASQHCLIENNIFYSMRHAMLVQNEAKWNVYGYNYSTGRRHSDFDYLPNSYVADISCHGETSSQSGGQYGGPKENLFEGNQVGWMWVDSFHRANGKDNAFFRNRSSDKGLWIMGVGTWGISPFIPSLLEMLMSCTDACDWVMQPRQITNYNYLQNVNWFQSNFLKFPRRFRSYFKPFERHNRIKKVSFFGFTYTQTWSHSIPYCSSNEVKNDQSYYLANRSSAPGFWYSNQSWPYNPEHDKNAAKQRYHNYLKKTVSRYDDNSFDQTFYITQDMTFPDDIIGHETLGNLYVLLGVDIYGRPHSKISIPENTQLIIQSLNPNEDLNISIEQFCAIAVLGRIKVIGTENNPVSFTGIDGNSWKGINFLQSESSADSEFRNVNFTDAKTAVYIGSIWGFDESGKNVLFDNCNFLSCETQGNTQDEPESHTGGAIIVNAASETEINVDFNRCRFENNTAYSGGAVYIDSHEYSHNELNQARVQVNFANCEFINNDAVEGGAIWCQHADLSVVNCYFEGNGKVTGFESTSPAINSNCAGGAVYLYESDLTFRKEFVSNVFVDNFSYNGGAFYINGRNGELNIDNRGPILFVNNTFTQNNSINWGGCFYQDLPSSTYNFVNNIFSNNTANITSGSTDFLIKTACTITPALFFNHNAFDTGNNGGIVTGYEYPLGVWHNWNNVDYNPISSIVGGINIIDGFQISTNSSCYNSGSSVEDIESSYEMGVTFPYTDVLNNLRVLGGNIDVGAVEYFQDGAAVSTSNAEICFGNIIPDGGYVRKIWIRNNSDQNNLQITSHTVSAQLSNVLEIISLPSVIPPSDSLCFKVKITPHKMYKDYFGELTINTNDIYNPEIVIPISAFTALHNGWNWISFPYLFVGADNEYIFQLLNPFGLSIKSDDGGLNYINNQWILDNPSFSFSPLSSYKLEMNRNDNQYCIQFSDGYEIQHHDVTLEPGVDNWVGYWRNSQDMDAAFGNDFSKVASIKSELWYYKKDTPQNSLKKDDLTIPLSHNIRPLNFGRGYIVRVKERIEDFRWNLGTQVPTKSPVIVKESDTFVYKKTDDYEAIDIIDIDDDIVEIGAYIGDTCVGSSFVDEGKTQILAYTDIVSAKSNSQIHFELITQQKDRKSMNNYFVYNEDTEWFVDEPIQPFTTDYHLVSFDKDFNDGFAIPKWVELSNNYPNPFNPITTISFSIPKETMVKLSVYNIKGQKVATLVNQEMSVGRHEIVWDGKNSLGKETGSGVYFYRLETSKKSITKKMLLLK